MASAKEYGYFIKGSKLALIEKDTALDNDVNSRDYGPDVTNVRFKSPLSYVTDGIELEYIYSPKYQVLSNPTIDINKFFINGWTIIEGYLTFLRNIYSTTVMTDWTSTPENAVTSGSSGDTGGQSLDYIVVRGSSRWNGLHKVQTAGIRGHLVTYTKVAENLPYWKEADIDIDTEEKIYDGGGDTMWLGDVFSAGDYVWIGGADEGDGSEINYGMWKIGSVTPSDSATAANSYITVDTKYTIVNAGNTTTGDTGLTNEYSQEASTSANTGASNPLWLYKAYRDFSYILTDVDVLNDEADEIPISEYLSKAVVYYLKAKTAEDKGDFQLKDVMMREFYRIVEKSDNAKIHTIRRVAPSSAAIR
jgi:hypothetical protein